MRLDVALDEIIPAVGTKKALHICGGSSLTYGELAVQSNAVADALRSAGVREGDRVGIISGHDIDAIILFWAVLRSSAIVVWLSAEASNDDLRWSIGNAEPRLIFFQTERQRELLLAVGCNARAIRPVGEFVLKTGHEDRIVSPGANASPEGLAAIVYTSGSSGRPKGVCLTHLNLWTVANSVISHMPIEQTDSYLMVVPLHYIHGIMQLLVHTLAGGTIYFYESFVFPRKVVEAIQTTRVTGFSGVPFHFSSLILRGGFLEADLPDLRWLTVTGGKIPEKRIWEILDHFPRVKFHIAYGQTECAPRATSLHPSKIRSKPDSVGSPIPNVSVVLLDDSGKPVSLGETGEVVIAGPNVMQGYWRDSDCTQEVIDEHGRLHTGDLGKFDAEGDLYLVGRITAMIKSAGERIMPEELERIIVAHPFADDAVVVGEPDDLYGQIIVAHLLRSAACGDRSDDDVIDTIREHCRASISYARSPRRFFCWDEFPRRANGKPDRLKIAKRTVREQ